jgi:hypothetical protein
MLESSRLEVAELVTRAFGKFLTQKASYGQLAAAAVSDLPPSHLSSVVRTSTAWSLCTPIPPLRSTSLIIP